MLDEPFRLNMKTTLQMLDWWKVAVLHVRPSNVRRCRRRPKVINPSGIMSGRGGGWLSLGLFPIFI